MREGVRGERRFRVPILDGRTMMPVASRTSTLRLFLLRLLVVVIACPIAAGITVLPWWLANHWPELTGWSAEATNWFFGMTMIAWAPGFFAIGVASAMAFGRLVWPMRRLTLADLAAGKT